MMFNSEWNSSYADAASIHFEDPLCSKHFWMAGNIYKGKGKQ